MRRLALLSTIRIRSGVRVGAVAGVLALSGCLGDAPHDNPLDPDSAAYVDAGSLGGRVTNLYPPFTGRSGARVHVRPDGPDGPERLVRTAPDGTFRVDGLPSGDYIVIADGDGLLPDTASVSVAVGALSEAVFELDALPVVSVPVVRTVHIENWPPLAAVFQVEVEVTATDPDRASDVEGAALVADGLALRIPLAETAPGTFTATLDAAGLPGGRVQSLLGQPLAVEVTDLSGGTGRSTPVSLVRVIEQTPLTFRPQISDPTPSNPPTLEWRPSDLPFAFTYRVEVFVTDGAGVLNRIVTASGLPSTQTTLTLPAVLPPGSYSWTVWTVDAAGNRSRSRPAGFVLP
ncbi:MAG TPA: carboxypeptidase-like regulatory domain-containing protein [Rubricoccaceae bacterium]